MKKMLLAAATAAVLTGLTGAGASAASIGVNFSGGDFGTPGPLAPTDSAGVVAQQNWNNEAGNTSAAVPVVDSSGAATPATVSWSSGNTWSNGDNGLGGANNTLLSNYLDGGSGGPANVTISNIPYATYDLYIYTQRDGATTSDYTVNGVTQNVTVAGSGFYNQNGFVLDGATTAGDYLVFSGLTASTVDLIASQVNTRSPIDGIQIVEVPEPASLGLAAAGGLALLARRRRLS